MGNNINLQGNSMQSIGKTIGNKGIANQTGNGANVPDFFMAFLNSIIGANDQIVPTQIAQATDTNLNLSPEDAQPSIDNNGQIQTAETPIMPIAMPIAMPMGFFQNTNIQNVANAAQPAPETDGIQAKQAIETEVAQILANLDAENGNVTQDQNLGLNNDTAIAADAFKDLNAKNDAILPPDFAIKPKTENHEIKQNPDFAKGDLTAKDTNEKPNSTIIGNTDFADTNFGKDNKSKNSAHNNELNNSGVSKSSNANHHQFVGFGHSIRELQNQEATKALPENKSEVIAAKINDIAQIMVDKAQNGEKKFFVRLDPPELGKVEIELKFGADNKVEALIRAQSSDALNELMRQARDMVDSLNQAGFNLKNDNLNFSLGHSNQNGANSEQFKKRKNSNLQPVSNEIEGAKEIKTQKWQRAGISLVA